MSLMSALIVFGPVKSARLLRQVNIVFHLPGSLRVRLPLVVVLVAPISRMFH